MPLYSRHELNNYRNRTYLKSALLLGDVMGKYQQQGDSAIYDTVVRMAQARTVLALVKLTHAY